MESRTVKKAELYFTATARNLKIYRKIANNSSLGMFSLTLYYAILWYLHIKIKRIENCKWIAFVYYEICSSYKLVNKMLEIIKMLRSCRDLNSGSLHTTAN
jgi:hypothetical protein